MPKYNVLDAPGGNVINTILASETFMQYRHPHYELVVEVVVPRKNVYTGAQFWKALTDAERTSMVIKAKATGANGAIFEGIKLNGLDFNDADDVVIGDKLVTAGIMTSIRLTEIIG